MKGYKAQRTDGGILVERLEMPRFTLRFKPDADGGLAWKITEGAELVDLLNQFAGRPDVVELVGVWMDEAGRTAADFWKGERELNSPVIFF